MRNRERKSEREREREREKRKGKEKTGQRERERERHRDGDGDKESERESRTVGLGTAFFQKTWRFGVHLRAGSGSTRVSHCKNRHFRGKTRQPKKRQKITNCPPHGPRAQFCGNTHLNFCTGQPSAISV